MDNLKKGDYVFYKNDRFEISRFNIDVYEYLKEATIFIDLKIGKEKSERIETKIINLKELPECVPPIIYPVYDCQVKK